MKQILIAAALAAAFAMPAAAQMAGDTAKTGTTMKMDDKSAGMAMSAKSDTMAMKPVKKTKKKMMSDKPAMDGAMKSDDTMKH